MIKATLVVNWLTQMSQWHLVCSRTCALPVGERVARLRRVFATLTYQHVLHKRWPKRRHVRANVYQIPRERLRQGQLVQFRWTRCLPISPILSARVGIERTAQICNFCSATIVRLVGLIRPHICVSRGVAFPLPSNVERDVAPESCSSTRPQSIPSQHVRCSTAVVVPGQGSYAARSNFNPLVHLSHLFLLARPFHRLCPFLPVHPLSFHPLASWPNQNS